MEGKSAVGSGQDFLVIQKVNKIRMFNFSDSRYCGLHAVLPPLLELTLTLIKENLGSSSLVRSVSQASMDALML